MPSFGSGEEESARPLPVLDVALVGMSDRGDATLSTRGDVASSAKLLVMSALALASSFGVSKRELAEKERWGGSVGGLLGTVRGGGGGTPSGGGGEEGM